MSICSEREFDSFLESILGGEEYQELKKMSPNSKISALRKLSEKMENGSDLSTMQTHLFRLMDEKRSHLEFAAPTVSPFTYDILVSDISEADLSRIGEELGVVALSLAIADPIFPVNGIMYGSGVRVFIPLVVKKRGISINVNFLFDTGSPNTHLRQETLHALGFSESVPSEINAVIHGTSLTVYLSQNHYENVDLLGQDFMIAVRGKLILDYPLRQCSLHGSD